MVATSLDLSQIKTDALLSASTFRTLIDLGSEDSPTFKTLVISDDSASSPVIDIAQTWNNGVTKFTAFKMDITDTASNASSLLMDLQVGGASKFYVRKDGIVGVERLVDASGDYYVTTGPIIHFQGVFAGATNGALGNTNGSAWSIAGALGWTAPNSASSTNDLKLERDAADTLALRRSANAQTFNIYNTYTDASNYERGFMRWSNNKLEIATEASGTGSANRSLEIGKAAVFTKISGNIIELQAGNNANYRFYFYPAASYFGPAQWDSNIDLGNSSVKWRNIYLGGTAYLTPTWNDAGTVFTALKVNVTDTASNASSLLMDLQVGGSSKFSVAKNGKAQSKADVNGIAYESFFTGYGVGFNNNGEIAAVVNNNSRSVIGHNIVTVGRIGIGSTPSYNISTDVDLYRDAADTLAQRRGTNPQTFRIYNTYTDASNYERGKLEWASNEFIIGTEAAGTGTARSLRLQVATSTAFYYQSVYGNIGIGTTGYGSSSYGGNIAIGDFALANTSQNNGQDIVAIGVAALRYLNVANSTDAAVAVGDRAGNRLRAATKSVLVGGSAGYGAASYAARITNTTCIGYEAGAGFDSTTITDNTCIGYRAGFALTTGSNNTLLGSLAGDSITTGTNNIAIGRDCDVDSTTASNQINIGNQYYHNRAFLYNTYTDASNYERGFLKWNSNVLEIGTESLGTGAARNVRVKGTYVTFQDNAAGFVSIYDANTPIVTIQQSTGLKTVINPLSYTMPESSPAPAGVANSAVIFAEDDGTGKTRLMVQFGTGVAQQIAIEP